MRARSWRGCGCYRSPRGIPTEYFHLFVWPHIGFLHALPVATRKAEVHSFTITHNLLAFLAIGLIVLHVAGALYHMARRDGTLRRIL